MFKKEFWKYFWTTYKDAKWLVVRYLIIAVYLTVSSVIANKMNLDNLTYFNAIIGLSAFGTITGFGISSGVGIFINQNIKNKEKVNHYVKIGMYLNFLFSLLFVLLLFVLYKPILHGLLGLSQGIDYTFYFLMLAYIFLVCILNYFLYTLGQLKFFWAQAIISLLEGILIIGGFLIIWLAFDLALVLVPYVYILAMICAITYAIIYLNKNKKMSVNIFKFTKIRLIKNEITVIWRMTAAQIVWQVGYSMLAFFLLKVSNVVFNQYSYFENVLDLFNGFYFSFIIVISINIGRSLGEGNFESAYKQGKYSLYGSVVIWFFYLILSLALVIPIINGMSVEIQNMAIVSMILYVIMYLFRFLSWNLFTYILVWGGKLKLVIWQEVIATLYYVLIYCLASYILDNLFLLYAMITFPTILQTILGLILFKKKRWMKKLSEDEIPEDEFNIEKTAE